MKIETWLEKSDLEWLVEMYDHPNSIKEFKQAAKDAIMKKLDIPDDESFELWYKLQ